MSVETIKVPDIGSDAADVIEVCVSAGDIIEAEDSLVVLESDKSSMEVPSPVGGKVIAVLVSEDDSVSEGSVLIEIEVAGESSSAPSVAEAPAPVAEAVVEKPAAVEAPVVSSASSVETIKVPDIGGEAEVIEICVSVGDEVAEEDSLVVLESEKSSMEVPSPKAGIVESIEIKEGETANEGDVILTLKVAGSAAAPAGEIKSPTPAADAKKTIQEPAKVAEQHQPVIGMTESRPTGNVYAGPAVRKMAREVGLDLV
ncbi:MAG: dihydrolipoamide acetyltransferase, partial [Sinobacterium sp.]|nr:dihydrolipoamide acetyltransferase [Sinobacterium sp.]